ncbi:helix-turn-helix domain-containing protein, partial [Myroides odoratimimus]
LLYSENSISEIAYNLNFSDSSYFTKYFKRYVGTTPKVFREL